MSAATAVILPALFLAFVVAMVFLFAAVKILRRHERALVFTLGKFQAVKGPGRGIRGAKEPEMPAPAAPSRLSDQFNAFLRSSLWIDRDGAPLSVLSALARLDLDPWEEAAGLSVLPPPSAAARLAAMLANLPGGPTVRRDMDAICVRSVGLLTRPASPDPASPDPARGAAPGGLGDRPGAFLFLVLGSWMVALTLMAAQGPAGSARPAAAATHAPVVPQAASRTP